MHLTQREKKLLLSSFAFLANLSASSSMRCDEFSNFILFFDDVPTALYGAEAWGMRSAERRKLNALEMKCLRSLAGVSRMNKVGNEDVRRRAEIERELASSVDQESIEMVWQRGGNVRYG